MNLGENIYTYRTQNNLSQGELANALDVSRQSVSKWENNLALPELDKLIRMSKLFSISLDELVYGPQPMQQTNNASSLPFSIFSTISLAGLQYTISIPSTERNPLMIWQTTFSAPE